MCILCSHFSVRDIPNDPCVEGWVVRTLGVVGGKKFASLVVLAAASAMSSDRCVPPGEPKKVIVSSVVALPQLASLALSPLLVFARVVSSASPNSPLRSKFCLVRFWHLLFLLSFALSSFLVSFFLWGQAIFLCIVSSPVSLSSVVCFSPSIFRWHYRLRSSSGARTQCGARVTPSLDTASRRRVRLSSLSGIRHPGSRP